MSTSSGDTLAQLITALTAFMTALGAFIGGIYKLFRDRRQQRDAELEEARREAEEAREQAEQNADDIEDIRKRLADRGLDQTRVRNRRDP